MPKAKINNDKKKKNSFCLYVRGPNLMIMAISLEKSQEAFTKQKDKEMFNLPKL